MEKKKKKKKLNQWKKEEKKNRTKGKKKSKVVKSYGWVLFVGSLCVFNYNIAIELWVMETEIWVMEIAKPNTPLNNFVKLASLEESIEIYMFRKIQYQTD